ncbi:MAG: PilZ domain-containing protein [Candidatus Omnitrophota bacterium]
MVDLARKKEMRFSPRVDFHSLFRYQLRGKPDFANAISSDISCGGLRFTVDKFIPTFVPVMLEINVLNRVLRPIGRVAWTMPLAHSNRNQMGIEFVEFNMLEKNYLKNFVNMRLS